MFKKSPLKSTRLAKHKRRIFLLKVSLGVIGVIVIVGGLSLLSHIHALAITDVAVVGNGAVDAASIQTIAQNDMKGSYYLLFPRSNRLLYPAKKIHDDLLQALPRLATVKLGITDSHVLTVTVTERTPAYTWCTGTPQTAATQTCYFMDTKGYIFSTAPQFSTNVFFAFYGLIPSDNPIGSHYLDQSTLKSMYSLSSFLTTNGIHAYALLADSSGIYGIYFGNNSRIIFKNDQQIPDVINNLQVIMQSTHIFAKNATSTLDYVDMRLGNKVYYKYVGDNS